MRRADKIRLANEAMKAEVEADDRDPDARDAARREWGQVRKSARDAFIAKGDWMGILDEYKNTEGFYTSAERTKMCKAYSDELITRMLR